LGAFFGVRKSVKNASIWPPKRPNRWHKHFLCCDHFSTFSISCFLHISSISEPIPLIVGSFESPCFLLSLNTNFIFIGPADHILFQVLSFFLLMICPAPPTTTAIHPLSACPPSLLAIICIISPQILITSITITLICVSRSLGLLGLGGSLLFSGVLRSYVGENLSIHGPFETPSCSSSTTHPSHPPHDFSMCYKPHFSLFPLLPPLQVAPSSKPAFKMCFLHLLLPASHGNLKTSSSHLLFLFGWACVCYWFP